MIEIKNGRVRVVGHDTERVVNFEQREAELSFARLLASGDFEIIRHEKAAIIMAKGRRAEKDSARSVGPTVPSEVRHRANIRFGPLAGTDRMPRRMTAEGLTAALAERVLGWKATPDRFVISNRRWMPRWRFQPTKNLEDAFRLLDATNPLEYTLRKKRNGIYQVQ